MQDDQTLAVLDGQQRLHALNEFVNDRLTIGQFPPQDTSIEPFKGLLFSELPIEMQRRVLNFKVPSYRLYSYEADEPHELFFRLNLPTGLTQAEKRNSLMGKSRSQVKELTEFAVSRGWQKRLVGFENARLAYDDVVARLCIYADQRTLLNPLTTTRMEAQFRKTGGFNSHTMEVARQAIDDVSNALQYTFLEIRPNKASILSWLLISARQHLDNSLYLDLREVLTFVEFHRRDPTGQVRKPEIVRRYLEVFDDRASLRVTDVMSVLLRDVAAWRIGTLLGFTRSNKSDKLNGLEWALRPAEGQLRHFEPELVRAVEGYEPWGTL